MPMWWCSDCDAPATPTGFYNWVTDTDVTNTHTVCGGSFIATTSGETLLTTCRVCGLPIATIVYRAIATFNVSTPSAVTAYGQIQVSGDRGHGAYCCLTILS